MSAPALRAAGLRKTYPSGQGRDPVVALDDLGFEVPRGTVFGLLGPNGAGKSTTVRILATLTAADGGEAVVDGLDVARRPGAVRRRIGLVSQRPSSDPMATGRENLVLAARLQGLSRAEAADRAAALLDRFALAEAADRLVRTWSGGMSRKLDVAIGLVHRPSVLFLDEPTTGLDPEARAEMWAEIGRLTRDDDTTVLLTTHYLDEADRLADALAIVDRGRVAVEGTPDGLKSELRGDAIAVELTEARDAARSADRVGAIPGVREVSVDERSLRARADEGARAVPLVLAALDEIGVAVSSATVARPSLDDVYLRHVGRTFEAVA
ncbi:MAG: ATP-binding cassette domain-containing protein [Nocardioidaceae bacterium]